jgi:hypothetical protein
MKLPVSLGALALQAVGRLIGPPHRRRLACISLAWKQSSHPFDRQRDEPITSVKKSVHDLGFRQKFRLA